jgi:predicted AAA+ superfamily ATPase
MTALTLKPWREVAVPHDDVLRGTFQQAEFAADLSRVHAGNATAEYQNPTLFFQRTFITEGMRLLLDAVVRRLAGKGGEPVIQLQTAFGGGKTHTMLAVYHLASGKVPASELAGIPPILDAAGVTELSLARVAVLDGIRLSPNQPVRRGDVLVHTLWGELAWQLGGAEGYALVAQADASGTSPGKAALETLLSRYAPCVILIDELVAYVRQFEEGKALAGGTFDSNLTFVQALTEAVKAVPTAVLLASLPESDREAGSQRGVRALEALAHYFGRVHALWKPVATEEAFEIVRRRLFAAVGDTEAKEAVCRAFAQTYAQYRGDFPLEVQDSLYLERLRRAYPIHPEVFDRLYQDWSSLDNFQRTRGVLKLMAKVIHRLWKDGNNDLMVMPGSLPLYDPDVRNEAIYYLPPGWDPVIERDVDGERAETTSIEGVEARFGAVQACRRLARAIFLGSAPHANPLATHQGLRGVELERLMLGVVQPGQQPSLFRDALARLTDRLHYLNLGHNRYWLDTRPNLRREMEERKRRFDLREDVLPTLRERIQRMLGSSVFDAVHVFTPSADVPDDWLLRLVVTPPEAGYSRSGPSRAQEHAAELLKKRGEQPRFKQNRLLFLAPDQDSVHRLQDHVRAWLAWSSILTDYQNKQLLLDNLMADQARSGQAQAEETLRRSIRETYRWLLAPAQEARPGKGLSDVRWEAFMLNTGTPNWAQEVDRTLKDNELVISDWAPIHLREMLKQWFWRGDNADVSALQVWQQTCQQLYLPRLKDSDVFQRTLAAGAASREFFGLAQGKEETRYVGFTFGQPTSPILDASLLLIEPSAAAAYQQAQHPPAGPGTPDSGSPSPEPGPSKPSPSTTDPNPDRSVATPSRPTSFYGTVELDPLLAKKKFAEVVDEVVQIFTAQPGVQVRIKVEIEAACAAGFDASTQRPVRENARVLGFRQAEFEEGGG